MTITRKPVYAPEDLRKFTLNFDLNKNILKNHGYQNIPLSFEDAYKLGLYTLFPFREELNDLFSDQPGNLEERKTAAAKRSLAALCVLHNKKTYSHPKAAEQIAGICSAVFDYDIGISRNGFVNPNVPYAIDNCGMGGDIKATPNVSTAALLIAAASGIPVCKHGSPSNADEGHHGSSDFIALVFGKNSFVELIGISKEKVEESIEKFNFGFIEACDVAYKVIHTQTHNYADLSHMNDIIGPITTPLNPCLGIKKIIGINQLIEPRVVAEAYKIMNKKKVTNLEDGIFVRGYIFPEKVRPENDGIDELSTMAGGTKIVRLKKGKITEEEVMPREFGLEPGHYRSINPKLYNRGGKGKFTMGILEGKVKGSAKEMILANAALIENLARGTSLFHAYKKMEYTLESGAVIDLMSKLRGFFK
ncbi:MAG: hypothetical protein KJ646_00165 [Nanoarchaeota archaeon]|nr:hypothetical protein [Nanoarchaeota archaeon]MBU4116540.1 hypothetical protein [Nanoarchaeota archaeon]